MILFDCFHALSVTIVYLCRVCIEKETQKHTHTTHTRNILALLCQIGVEILFLFWFFFIIYYHSIVFIICDYVYIILDWRAICIGWQG